MLFSDNQACVYSKAPAMEVICQLRFPTILSINSQDPVDFQEQVRDVFPRYEAVCEQTPPKIKAVPGQPPVVEPQKPFVNHTFRSADGAWQLNLSKDFISLSTRSYLDWKSFAGRLDKPLAAFIKIYRPAYFERIGLRYINAVSRRALQLEDRPWRDLIRPAYLGILAEEDVRAEGVHKSAVDAEFALDSSCHAKIHAGPGLLKSKDPRLSTDNEQRFILDFDLFMTGNITAPLAAAGMETLHNHADALFQGAITDELHEAML